MDFLELALRAAIPANKKFLPYFFDGVEEPSRLALIGALSPHVPEQVDSMFNTWHFWQNGDLIGCRRATWEMCWHASAKEICERIEKYYKEI